MTHRRGYRDMSEEQLEDLVRGLPQREPRPHLRDRILAAAAAPRPTGRRGPALAVAALVFLVLADLLVLRSQVPSGAPPTDGPPPAVACDEVALRRELGLGGRPLRVAGLPTARPDSGLRLRTRMLTELGGG
jgi:hypothetical protein